MSTRPIPALLVFGLAAAARAATYPVHHLDPADALMALNARVPGLGQDCRFSSSRANDPKTAGLRGVLDVTCNTESIQAKIQPALDAIDAAPTSHRFHVAVLTASRKEGPTPEVTPGEAKALNDFKKVMTYKSFQVEAETIFQSDSEAETQLNGNYALEIMINPNNGAGDAIDVQRFRLRSTSPQTVPNGGQTFYPTYIETSFSIKHGETIVLGTSTSDQQARVVLVSALP